MAVLNITNLPDTLVERIAQRAKLHGRTPEQEAAILLDRALAPKEIVTPRQLLAEARAEGIQTPPEAARMVREDRDAR